MHPGTRTGLKSALELWGGGGGLVGDRSSGIGLVVVGGVGRVAPGLSERCPSLPVLSY